MDLAAVSIQIDASKIFPFVSDCFSPFQISAQSKQHTVTIAHTLTHTRAQALYLKNKTFTRHKAKFIGWFGVTIRSHELGNLKKKRRQTVNVFP